MERSSMDCARSHGITFKFNHIKKTDISEENQNSKTSSIGVRIGSGQIIISRKSITKQSKFAISCIVWLYAFFGYSIHVHSILT